MESVATDLDNSDFIIIINPGRSDGDGSRVIATNIVVGAT
jgi:hypothetical protein